jgi:hypothetical protein
MNDHESDALWKLYLKGSQGIAIQSTAERVKSSFEKTGTHPVYMAVVEYIDYENFMPSPSIGSAEPISTWLDVVDVAVERAVGRDLGCECPFLPVREVRFARDSPLEDSLERTRLIERTG